MNFANVIYYSYVTFLVLAFIMLSFFILKIIHRLNWKPEKISIFVVLFYSLIISTAFLSAWKVEAWKDKHITSLQYSKTNERKIAFFQQNYPELVISISGTTKYIRRLNNDIKIIQQLSPVWKNHEKLLGQMGLILHNDLTKLNSTYNKANEGLDNAWKNRHSNDPIYWADDEFHQQAAYLNKQLLEKHENVEETYEKIQYILHKNLRFSRQFLQNKKIKLATEFSVDNYQTLLKYMQRTDLNRADTLVSIYSEIEYADQQQANLRESEEDQRRLKKLSKVIMARWISLRTSSADELRKILYSLEAEYIANQLHFSDDTQAILSLREVIDERLTLTLRKIENRRSRIEKSYPPVFFTRLTQ